MSTVRQKQMYDGQTGVTHYEITFTALAHDWITNEQYEEISEMIDAIILVRLKPCVDTSGCKPLDEVNSRIEEYADAITDLTFLYDLLRVEGKDADSDFMKGIKYAHDYLTNKQK